MRFLRWVSYYYKDINPIYGVITGDLIAGVKSFSTDILVPLKRLSKKIDTYFVLGNHEMGLW